MLLTRHLKLPRLLRDIGPPLLPAELLTVRQNASHSRCYTSFPEQGALGISCPRVTDTKAKAFAVRELTAAGYQTQPFPEPDSASQPEWAGRWEQHLLWQNTGCCRSPWMATPEEERAGWRHFLTAHAGSSCDFNSQLCCTRPNCLQHKPACIPQTSYRAVYSSIQKALWRFDRQGSVSETFLAPAWSI